MEEGLVQLLVTWFLFPRLTLDTVLRKVTMGRIDEKRLNPASPAYPHREQSRLKRRRVAGAGVHSFKIIENEARVASSGENQPAPLPVN